MFNRTTGFEWIGRKKYFVKTLRFLFIKIWIDRIECD